MKKEYYVEILGDTVSPNNTIFSIIISTALGLGGFLLGKKIFPMMADAKMVASYSLLLGIGGCVIALVICALLFRPKRVLSETQIPANTDILKDLQIDLKEENDVIQNDPITRAEMENLKIKDLFAPSKGGDKE